MEKIKNFMEQVVKDKLDELLEDRDDICKCEQCRTEMLTYALNHLPPKYVSSEKGEFFSKLDNQMSTQQNADISRCLLNAIQVVSNNPRHN